MLSVDKAVLWSFWSLTLQTTCGGKISMLTEVNQGIFISIVFRLVYHSFTNGLTP